MQRRLIHTHAHTHTPHTHTHAHSMHSLHLWFFVTGGGQARSEADDHADTYLFFLLWNTHVPTTIAGTHACRDVRYRVRACLFITINNFLRSTPPWTHLLLSLTYSFPSIGIDKKKTKQKKRESCPDNNTKNTHRNTHIHARRTDVMINLLTLGSASGRYACVSVCECCSHTVSVWTLVGQLRINCSHLLAELSSLFSLTLFLSLDD